MASRKLLRDVFLCKRALLLSSASQQGASPPPPARLLLASVYPGRCLCSVLNDFSKQVKGEANRHQEFQHSIKELKEKSEVFKGATNEPKVRTKQKTNQMYKHVDAVRVEDKDTAKKARETLGSNGTPNEEGTGTKDGAQNDQTKESTKTYKGEGTFFGKLKSAASQRLMQANVPDLLKRGYDAVRDEIYGNPNRRKHLEVAPQFRGKTSKKTDLVVLPSKCSQWSKKWEAFRVKMQGHPLFKRLTGISEPVITKSQEIVEDMRERWETTDNPIVHKIQDVGETIFQETDTAASVKEIWCRDPSFSLPDFVSDVQEVIRPVLEAYMKGDMATLRKYCCPEVAQRCEAERKAFQGHDIFFDNKILHVSDVDVRETKMMGTTPIIIVAFQTQQVHCVRDRHGAITEGGKDTIHTVYYAWAMQQIDAEELGEGAVYPIWKLREMQQLGVQSLI